MKKKDDDVFRYKPSSSSDEILEEAEIINNLRETEEDIAQKENIRKQLLGLRLRSQTKPNKTAPVEDLEWRRPKKGKNKQVNAIKYMEYRGVMCTDEVDKIDGIWNLNSVDRIRFYRYLVDKLKEDTCKKLTLEKENYKNYMDAFEKAKDEESLDLLKNAKVIGMTTTGAAKNQNLLCLLKPKIVIAEEAAEVFESSIITCLTESCEQLILIGDNEQLAPSPNLYKLSKHYHLNVSLFERLVNNKFPKVRLNLQHRMRPEISFLMKYFYDDLIDDEIVKNYENVKGIDKNVFFIDHCFTEEGDEDSLSKSNIYEAAYLVR
jgi:hypothetical protein